MGFKISEKFKECLGNALSAIIRVFLYFVIFEENVNAVVYILATYKFWQNLQKKMINLAWYHLKWMQMYLQRMIYKRAPLFQGPAAPTQREREPFCLSLLWHDWFVQACWLLLSVRLQKNGNRYSWRNWQRQWQVSLRFCICDSNTTWILKNRLLARPVALWISKCTSGNGKRAWKTYIALNLRNCGK